MSRHYHRECCNYGGNSCGRYEGNCGCGGGFLGGAFSGNILNLIIFVLIVLQFGRNTDFDEEGCEGRGEFEIDNSILFIIALFFLFVCSCGNGCGCTFGGGRY